MSSLSMFMYTGGGLLLVLLLLFITPKIKDVLKKRKERSKIVKIKKEEYKRKLEKRIEKKIPTIIKRGILIKEMIASFILVVLLGLFLIFETNIVEFVKGYAIELAPVNYVSLFTILGLVFVVRGILLALRSKRVKNNSLKAFVWVMQGFALSMVALFYDFLNLGHVGLFGINFSWLIVLLAVWEIIVLVSIIWNYKKVC